MVLVLIQSPTAQVYFIDGVHRCEWHYINDRLSLDWLGELCLDGPSLCLTLTPEVAADAAATIRSSFPGCDITAGSLWKLDPSAPDYQNMLQQHKYDLGIRVSFEGTLPSKATISTQLLEHLILSGSKDPLAAMPADVEQQIRNSNPVLYRNLQFAHNKYAPAAVIISRLTALNTSFSCQSCGHTWKFNEQRTETVSFGRVLMWCPSCTVLAQKFE
jgi:hypothetical protein